MSKFEFHDRFREERLRLGFRSQEALARQLGVHARTVNQYEVGNSVPGLKELFLMESLGADLLYLLRGVRLEKYTDTRAGRVPEMPHITILCNAIAALPLSEDDAQLLLSFARRLASAGKD